MDNEESVKQVVKAFQSINQAITRVITAFYKAYTDFCQRVSRIMESWWNSPEGRKLISLVEILTKLISTYWLGRILLDLVEYQMLKEIEKESNGYFH